MAIIYFARHKILNMKAFFFIVALIAVSVIQAQNCNYYYFQNNKTITMGFFNKKGSQDGTLIYKISGVEKTGGTTTGTVVSEYFDKKKKSYGQSTGKMKCSGGVLLIDMKTLLSPQQNQQFQSADVQGKGFYLEYPSVMKVGETLKDGSFDMDMKMESGLMARIKMDLTDRVVQAKESVTTPAGSWEAFKINYNSKTVIDMGFAIPIRMEMTEWFVPNLGVVKTEHKMGKSELLSIE